MKQRIMKHIAAGLMALWMTGLVSGAATNDTFDFEKELALLEAQQDELVADAAGSTNVVVTQAAKSEEALVVPEMGTDRSFNMWRSVGSLLIIVGCAIFGIEMDAEAVSEPDGKSDLAPYEDTGTADD